MLGWLTLVVLTSSAVFTAVAIGLRARLTGRAELAILSAVLFVGLTVGPVFLLGYSRLLTAWSLALLAAAVHAGAFWIVGRGRLKEHARVTLRTIGSLALLPFDGLREAIRARSLVTLALVGAAMIIGWSAIMTYLATSDMGWDAIFYHEPIVGYAIQNHGFAQVELPQAPMFQTINGYPRVGESLALWFVIFTDRTFIEIGNTLAAGWLTLAAFALARRYGDRVTSMAWGAILIFEHSVWTQLRTVYIDTEFTFLVVTAIYFATRPEYRVRDAVCTLATLALVVGMKGSGLLIAPPIALVAILRLVGAQRWRRIGAIVAVTFGGAAALLGVAALTLIPNWTRFKNPVWPITLDVKSLHLHFDGLIRFNDLNPETPLKNLIDNMYTAPVASYKAPYASGTIWIILPLTLVAVTLIPFAVVRDWVFFRRLREASNLLWVVCLGLVAAALSNSLATARYNIPTLVTFTAAVAWLTGGKKGRRLGEAVAAAAFVLNFLPMVVPGAWDLSPHAWEWNWGVSHAITKELMAAKFSDRAWMTADSNYMPRATALQREKELGPGDRVAFTREQTWLAPLWNSHMSNVVNYIPFDDAAQFNARLRSYDPKWVVVGGASPARAALAANEWELVGEASPHDRTVAFRRIAGLTGL